MAAGLLAALTVGLGIDTAAFSEGLKGAQSKVAGFGKSMKTGLVAAGAAATAAFSGVAYAAKGAIDAFDAIEEASQKIGIPIEELSRLKYAAEISGVSFNALQTGARKLSSLMADSANGVSSATEAMSRFGLSATNADGSLKSASQVMAEVADKFAAMPDGVHKTAMAVDLFGKAGTDMILMLNGGSQAINGLMLEAENFGQVVTQEAGQSAAKFNENLDRLKGTFGTLAGAIATAALPALVSLSDAAVTIAGSFQNLPGSMQTAIVVVGGLTVAVTALAVPLAAVVISFGAISVPVLAAVAAIAAITAAVIAFWPEIKAAASALYNLGVTIKDNVVTAFHNFQQASRDAGEALRQSFIDAVNAIRELPAQMVQIGQDIIAGLWNGISNAASGLKDKVSGIASGIKDSFTGFFQIRSPSRVMMDVGGHIIGGLNDGMSAMQGQSQSIAESIGSTIGNAFKGVLDGSKSVKDALKEVLLSVTSMIANNAFKSLLGGIGGGKGGGFLGSMFGGLMGFANGGSFQVGGAGGVDSQLVAFKASPNERVSITKPGQSYGNGGGQAVTVNQTFQVSGAISSDDIVRAIKQQAAATKAQIESGFATTLAKNQRAGKA